jgi:hypothetical protein
MHTPTGHKRTPLRFQVNALLRASHNTTKFTFYSNTHTYIYCYRDGRRKNETALAPARGKPTQKNTKPARSQRQARSEPKPRTPAPQPKRGTTSPAPRKQTEHGDSNKLPPTAAFNHLRQRPGLPAHRRPTRGRRGRQRAIPSDTGMRCRGKEQR